MKVWTLITKETLRLLKEGIPYYGDEKICPIVDFPYTPGGYSLLVNKMIQSIGVPPVPSAVPIWGYYLYGGENNIPENLDFDNFPDEASVCLTLEVPDRKLLLSDSLMWDSISLGEYVPNGDTPEELDSDYESDGTSISGIISNLNNFIVVVEDENGTETSIYIGDIVGCASEVSKKK